METILKALLLLLWVGICRGADSSVYAYTEHDGSLFLSNVPTDRRYVLLVGKKGEAPRAQLATTYSHGGSRSARPDLYSGAIERAASLYGLESSLLHAVIAVESGYDPAVRSSKGATGLMQLMPGTAKRYGVIDAVDPEQNIDGGARYLRDLFQMFDGDVSLVLAAYNAGEAAVTRNNNRVPQFRETLEYIPKVLAHYKRNQAK